MITRIFTFGYGHVCPFTGKGLGDHYATVTAPDASSARTLMNATFNRQWAFEYGVDDVRLAEFPMTEHARLSIGVPPTQTTCHGAPAGIEADCGAPGPHGPH